MSKAVWPIMRSQKVRSLFLYYLSELNLTFPFDDES